MESALRQATRRTAPIIRAAALVTLPLVLTALVGCSHVVRQSAHYYENGPNQLAGPQGELKEGTHVLRVGREGSYSRIWTITGVDAYVWDAALESIWKWPKAKDEEETPPDDDS